MNFQNSLALVVVILLAPCTMGDRFYNSIEQEQGRRTVVRCISGSDCGPNECSVMGMQRFSEPECRPRGDEGAPCRMYAEQPENKTLHFPHVTMECQDVYMQFCPCGPGLVCREAQCRQAEGELESEQVKSAGLAGGAFPWALARFH